jgi:hypothetical protein
MLRMKDGVVRAEIRDGIAYGYDANGICVFQEPICKPRKYQCTACVRDKCTCQCYGSPVRENCWYGVEMQEWTEIEDE